MLAFSLTVFEIAFLVTVLAESEYQLILRSDKGIRLEFNQITVTVLYSHMLHPTEVQAHTLPSRDVLRLINEL